MKKILLVDDIKEIYQMLLHSVNEVAEVTWANCLHEASVFLLEKNYHLLILDVELPDGNGIEYCSRIKALHPNIPILFITSHQTLAEKHLALSVGANGFITKPFSPEAENDMNELLEMYLVG